METHSSHSNQNPAQMNRGTEHAGFHETLHKGSKTFSSASLFFSHQTYEDVARLYTWCRTCDDITDGSTLGFHQNPKGLPAQRVDQIWEKTLRAIHHPELTSELPFQAFGELMKNYQIPIIYAEDLVEGMRHDALEKKCKTWDDLILYCYQVAGTVGLMMTHLIGLKNPRALKNAVSLGIALQLTNIVRDLGDDFKVGRIYIPTDWLDELQIPHDQLLDPPYAPLLEFIMRRLLIEAHRHYKEGFAGLIDLPLRSALAVSVAACQYQAIGNRTLKLAPSSLKTRTLLRPWDRILATCKGVFLTVLTLPHRVVYRRPTLKVTEIWRPT